MCNNRLHGIEAKSAPDEAQMKHARRAEPAASRFPIAKKIRNAGKYAPVVADPRFLPELLRSDHSIDREFFSERLAGSSLSRRQIKALCVFQMSGCHALATSGLASEGDWPELQETIDAFIDGGITALGKKHAALTGTQAAEQGVS